MTFIQDNRNASTLTPDSRTAVESLTQDNKTVSGNLWSATIHPWLSTFYPWAWQGNGQIIIMDNRN